MATEIDPDRLAVVRDRAEEWAKRLIDLGHRNTLLYFRNTKTASIDLTEAAPETLEALTSGSKVRLGLLILDQKVHKDACTRARNLSNKILLFREEQGVEVGKVAFGLVRTPEQSRSTGTVRPLRAPLLLRSVIIKARTASENDFTLELGDDVEVNPVLLHALDQQFGIDVDVDEFTAKAEALLTELSGHEEQVEQIYRELSALAGRQHLALTLEKAIVLGLFNYEKLPMVNDLRGATELLAQHDLIAAMAGYEPAVDDVVADSTTFNPPKVDNLLPADEYLAQDADSSQHRAISTALAGQHVLVEGPPGTGKSQTIANIIAGAAAVGKTVLFVAEKRAALEAVTNRLGKAGLDGLIFDLHQQKVNRRQIAQQLAASLDKASKEPPVDVDALHIRLVDRREQLARYDAELHVQREPWDLSARDVQTRLLGIDSSCTSRQRFRGQQLRDLNGPVVRQLEADLKTFVDLGGVRILRRESPWCNSLVRNVPDVEQVLCELDQLADNTLRRSHDGMQRLLAQTGLAQPPDIAGWQDVLELLDCVAQSVQAFGPDIFGEHLNVMYYATAPRAERSQYPQQLPWKQRRALVKQLKGMSLHGLTKKAHLHAALAEVVGQRERWGELGGQHTQPAEVLGLRDVMQDYAELRRQLTSVALSARLQNLEAHPPQHVAHTLEQLRDDKTTLWRLPRLTELRERFHALGLTDFLQDAANQHADPEQTWSMFQRSWLASLDDEFKLRNPVLREFAAEQQNRIAAEFQASDREHRITSAKRVRRQVARRLLEAKNDFSEEARTVRDQASRKRGHKPIRKLVEEASHVLLALRPCWAMSPLVVSKMLPAVELFDLVVFDEASQIRPHEAITSIMRGKRLVVAGDDKQLPPTNFFDRMLTGGDEDDDEVDLDDYESILTTLRSKIPHQHMLKWHYRSADERLISFSNREIYGNNLVTFPGTAQSSPISVERVEGVASPGQDGSAPAEVERVVQLVLAHAESRPGESLGVITMGVRHQARIEQKIREARRDRPDLDEFFSDDAGPGHRFFVKNLESVQGDERDAIVLSMGAAKGANGRVSRSSFGPLNLEGGERRLNVAVTRAKRRMTVVASFHSTDLEPLDRVNGTELLRRYLEFAEQRGEIDQVGRREKGELNGFERTVLEALEGAGIQVYPQWGFSGYRIDFALAHRDNPGRMVLAVEADGDTYHRAESARDRDRLRQQHLESLGWQFHRLWASAWFTDPAGETAKIVETWQRAMEAADSEQPTVVAEAVEPDPPQAFFKRGPRPNVPAGLKTHEYSDNQLIGICYWLMSDRLLLDREERIDQVLAELGYKRRGALIVERLTRAVEIAQGLIDKEES